VLAKSSQSVVAYRSQAPHAERAHPTDEHFLPLLIAMGASSDADSVRVLDGDITYGVISMESYVWGLA
jgi:4,5-DOPA dioxygenase extradiol